MEAAVSSLRVGGVDPQLGEGGGQVSRAAATTQRGRPWETRFVLVQWRGQWRGEVEAGEVRQRAASVQRRGNTMSRRGRLLRGSEDTDRKQNKVREIHITAQVPEALPVSR